MRMTLANWAAANYDKGSMPCKPTLRNMAHRGDIPGAFQDKGNRWWVNVGDTVAHQLQGGIDHLIKDDPQLQELFSSGTQARQ